MLSFLTVNIGAAARERAEALLGWLAKRSEDDYRRPLKTFAQTISTVIALHFYNLACE
jgi:hypothetical protein